MAAWSSLGGRHMRSSCGGAREKRHTLHADLAGRRASWRQATTSEQRWHVPSPAASSPDEAAQPELSHSSSGGGGGGGSSPDYSLVSEEADLAAMLDELRSVSCVAVDCEGIRLGDVQSGSKLTLIQLSARRGNTGPLRIWLVDVLALGPSAFAVQAMDKPLSSSSCQQQHTPKEGSRRRRMNSGSGPRAFTLRALLEDEGVTKLMYDVRSDSAQLQHEHSVRLRGVYDLQLAEVAVRQLQFIPTAFVLPLDKALSNYVSRTVQFEEDMVASYEIARAYHYNNRTEVWAQRPLTQALLKYAATDVRYLHELMEALNMKLPVAIVDKVHQASAGRTSAPASAVGDKRRAEAPVIVRRSDVLRLINSRAQQPPAQRAAPPPSRAQLSQAGTGGVDGDTAGAQLNQREQHAATVDRQRQPRQRPTAQHHAPPGAAPQPQQRRFVPQRLPLVGPGPGNSEHPHRHTAPGGDTFQASAPLLQPRKRAEGEEAPLWIYDSVQPPLNEPQADSVVAGAQLSLPAQTEVSGQEPLQVVSGSTVTDVASTLPLATPLLWAAPKGVQQPEQSRAAQLLHRPRKLKA